MHFMEINPDEIRLITRNMVADALDKDNVKLDYKLTKLEFSKFLDMNQIIRTIILRSVNP